MLHVEHFRKISVRVGVFCAVIFGFSFTVVEAVTYDLSDSTNWNIRLDGTSEDGVLGLYKITTGDVNNDDEDDLIVTEYTSDYLGPTITYVIYSTLLATLSGTGNIIDLADNTKYNLRIIGAGDEDYSEFYPTSLVDLNDNDLNDLVISYAYASHGGVDYRGAVYVLYDSLLDDYAGTGNTIDLANAANFNLKLIGAAAFEYLGYSFSTAADLNNDDRKDLLVTASFASNNARPSSGSTYVIYSSLLDAYGETTGNVLDLGTDTNFNIRYDGPTANNFLETYIIGDTTDIDNDGNDDLMVFSPLADNNGRTDSGSAYIIFNTLIEGYLGTGNIVDLATSTNWNIRIDAPEGSGGVFGYSITYLSDINADGDTDLILGSAETDYNNRDDSGSVYILLNSLLSNIDGTGNTLDLADNNNFNVRFDGESVGSNAGYDPWTFDYDNDGRADLIFEDCCATGSTYVINNTIFGTLNSTGNLLDLASSSSYSHKYDGASGWTHVPYAPIDLNGDGAMDYVIVDSFTDYNTRTDSGSVFIIYNFPHTISIDTASSTEIVGTVDAATSTVPISGVQYSFNDNSPTASSWNDCIGTDSFVCTLDDTPKNDSLEVYIRAFDENVSYTVQSSYSLTTLDTAPPVRSNGAPADSLSANTNSAVLEVTTSEDATCRYSTTPGVAYDDMVNEFQTTDDTTFTATISNLTNNHSYEYYVRCQDMSNNSNDDDYVISFSIESSSSGSGSTRTGTRNRTESDESSAAQIPALSVTHVYFDRDLSLGVVGSDVFALQKYLNANGFILAQSGAGAPGSETYYFGPLTFSAVVAFQEAHSADILAPLGLSGGTGYVGPSTRNFINKE